MARTEDELPTTDPERWRLELDHGAHSWRYLSERDLKRAAPQSTAEKYFLGLPIVSFPTLHLFIDCPY
jgi:hypothetical protein